MEFGRKSNPIRMFRIKIDGVEVNFLKTYTDPIYSIDTMSFFGSLKCLHLCLASHGARHDV